MAPQLIGKNQIKLLAGESLAGSRVGSCVGDEDIYYLAEGGPYQFIPIGRLGNDGYSFDFQIQGRQPPIVIRVISPTPSIMDAVQNNRPR